MNEALKLRHGEKYREKTVLKQWPVRISDQRNENGTIADITLEKKE